LCDGQRTQKVQLRATIGSRRDNFVVTKVATTRLIDASAVLEPADRALVNLWVNRGLDDAAVARMTHTSEAAIAERRARIVEQLSAELGLPPENVGAALAEITLTPEGPDTDTDTDVASADSNGSADLSTETETETETPEPAETDPEVAGPEVGAAEPEPDGASQQRRRRRPVLLVLVALVAVVVLVIVLTSGGAGHRRVPTPTTASATTSASATTTSTTATGPASSTGTTPAADALTPLPGGLTGVHGTVGITRHGGNLTLNLRVTPLRSPVNGHYEVWLYNSLLSSEPLGRLRSGVTDLVLRLPAGAKRYRWIDVSFQPLGDTYHSGESVLRARNPLLGGAASPSS
jgi:hypothetical protein